VFVLPVADKDLVLHVKTVAPLGPDYISPISGLRASTCYHFYSVLGFCRRAVFKEISSAAELKSTTATTSHANQVTRAV
jgi:hypothetical protein